MTDGIATKPWGDPENAKVLVIGHDPRLQDSSTVAEHALFADYYFRAKPAQTRELAKYELANALFRCIKELTSGRVMPEEVLVTNLCNQVLPRPAGRRVVLIPEAMAAEGLKDIREILARSRIRLIFAMAQQVNYWLQTLGFCAQDSVFVEDSRPKYAGTHSLPPYYEPARAGAFRRLCGHRLVADGQYCLFPILHVKNFPLRGPFLVYDQQYTRCRMEVAQLLDSFRLAT